MGVFFRSWSEQVTEPSVVDQDHAKVRTPCPSTLSPASALSALLATSGSLLNTTHRSLRVFLIATTSKPARADSLFSIEVIMKLCTYDRVTSTNTDRNITLVLLKRLKLSQGPTSVLYQLKIVNKFILTVIKKKRLPYCIENKMS